MMIFLREKFIAQIFMWVIAVVFVLVSVMVGPQLFSGSSGQGGAGAEGEVVIRIDGFEVSRNHFEAMVSQQMRSLQNNRFGGVSDRKEIEKRVIDNLIRRAIEGSASITDAEVEHFIRSDENRVRQYNELGGKVVIDFYKYQLSEAKLRENIQSLELVTDTEVEQAFNLEADKAKVKYIEFRHSDYLSTVNVDDAEAEAFFQENIDNFRTEEQVNVKFIKINPIDFVTQHDVVTYYTENQSEFKTEDLVRARHILKKFPENATDEEKTETKTAAEELLKTVKSGLAAGTSFADLAKEHSEGPSGADGGALGTPNPDLPPGKYFGRGQMVKPFEEACFDTLKPGEVSELVETRFGYHIITLEEKFTSTLKPFTEVEGEIRDKLVQINGVDGAKEVAEDLVYDIEIRGYESAILDDRYKDLSLSVGETDFFPKDTLSIPDIGSLFTYGGLVKELFDMEVGVTRTIETKNYSGDVSAFFVATVLGKKPPMIPKFEDVKDDVISGSDGLQNKKSKASAFAAAQSLFGMYSDNESLDDLIKKYKAPEGTNTSEKSVQESSLFNLNKGSSYISGMGNSKDAMFAAFNMSAGEVRGPFQGDSAAYIIELVERVEPDLELYQTDPSQRTKRYQTLLQRKKTDIYDNWFAARKKAANIWIHEDYR